MAWSDNVRCLYCDGKLPLYRKITSGQFCSAVHRKSYWQDQERLAVERLALLAAVAALNKVSPRHAELFAATRLAGNHAGMYGAVDLAGDDIRGLLARALP